MELTASQVNRAGKVARDYMRLRIPTDSDTERFLVALEVIQQFRASHNRPLTKANNGLRSMLQTEDAAVEVSQRLKRLVTILNKLQREPTMALSRMQDIGGCRAVVSDFEELDRVRNRLMMRRPPVRVDDYVARPRSSGYRAVHLIVVYDDRPVEIQLRTRQMHDWAVFVEQLGSQTGFDLKSGIGPPEILAWLASASRVRDLEERGEPVDSVLQRDLEVDRESALRYLNKEGTL